MRDEIRAHPSMLLLLGLVVGILSDGTLTILLPVWLGIFFVSFLARGCLRRRSGRISVVLVVLVIISASGASAHVQRRLYARNDIRTWASTTRQQVVLVGEVANVPATRTRTTLLPGDQPERFTRFELNCQQLVEPERTTPVTGRVIVSVDGVCPELFPGADVTIYGQLQRPAAPLNPTDFDYARYLDDHHLAGTLRVDHPSAVMLQADASVSNWDRFWHLRQSARAFLLSRMREVMPEATFPLAAALLLGARDDLSGEVVTAFQNTGLMHLISISGLHLAMIVGMFVVAIKLLPARPLARHWILIGVLLSYLFFVDLRPPVIRAGMLVMLWMLASLLLRDPSIDHLLVLTTIVLLVIDPSSLFDVGAQLSFLCVYAIGQADRWYRARKDRAGPKSVSDEPKYYWRRLWARHEFAALWIPLSIVVITAPYLLSLFGQFSAISLLLSLPISAVLGVILLLGVALLPLLALPAIIVTPLAMLFHWSLLGLQELVIALEQLPGFLWHASGPGAWWTMGHYLIWLLPLAMASTRRRLTVWHRRALTLSLCWCLVGAGVLLANPWFESKQMDVVFHAVGHGNATILKLPNGRTLLIDAGSLYGSPYTVASLRRTLTALNISRLDVAVISHNDADHYNLLPHLAQTIQIKTLLVSHVSLQSQTPALLDLCDQLIRNGSQIRCVQSDDALQLDPDVRLQVLHPSFARTTWADSDNENSVVMSCTYAGRTMLLPGDLDGTGLDRLIETPLPDRVDLLVMPHHGARGSNPIRLGEWAQPVVALASTNKTLVEMPYLNGTYPDAQRLVSTAEGAVRVSWTLQHMNVAQYRDRKWSQIAETR